MRNHRSTCGRGLTAALLAWLMGLGAAAAHETPYANPFVKGSLVQVDVYDRADSRTLPTYPKDGAHYIVGTPGHEYAVRIRNTTGARVLIVTSVDGVNVISGDTASPSQSGYVLEPWGSVEIGGWRKSMSRTAAFFFTEHQNSYAARTGRPDNVGVIGVAAFQERTKRISWRPPELRGRIASAEADAQPSETMPPPATPGPAPMDSRANGQRGDAAAEDSASAGRREASSLASKLGTGHGRSEDSRVTLTNFERATATPAETVAIRYDRRENLIAMGVLPQTPPHFARRAPEPFPGSIRFAPDPDR